MMNSVTLWYIQSDPKVNTLTKSNLKLLIHDIYLQIFSDRF